ncbi:MAG: glycoside hydrolase family 3 protein, partial [Candidatus Cryptobacteroides sp.]
MNKSTHIPLIALTLMLAACTASPAYKNPALSSEKRTADLLSRMTLEEKLGQLVCPLGWPMYEKSTEGELSYSEEYVKFISQQHGGMLWATFRADPWTRKTLENGLYPREAAIVYNKLQHYAVDSTRLGIPIILAEEAPHGHMAIGTTVFPTGIALASTWDRELLREVGLAVNRELCAVGARIGYGPVVDLAREPRWSRVEETFGEDVCLTTQMASAMVEGTSEGLEKQGGGVISTLKHFAAYGIPQGGHNGNPSYIGQRDLRENFYPAFKGAIDAGALSVMTSYNSIDGIPSTANASMLRSLLKKEWGFEGFVISDLVSIDGLMSDHRIASSLDQAAQLALKAGVDVDLGGNCFPLLKESVEKGLISTKMLDDAVSRVLKLKFELGLFDHPYVDPDSVESIVRRPEHGEVALRAARESVVLLE